jgi:hypothetical protein
MPDESKQSSAQTVRVEHAAAKSEGPDASASVPSFRLREESERRRKAETRTAELSAEVETLRSEYAAAATSLRQTQTTHAQDMHLFGLGFDAPSVRRFLRREYTDATAEFDEESRPAFADWLDSNRADPLYAVHFDRLGAMENPKPAATEADTAAPDDKNAAMMAHMRRLFEGNPNAGASQPAAHNGREYSGDEIAAIRGKARGTLGQHKDAVLSALRAEGLIK